MATGRRRYALTGFIGLVIFGAISFGASVLAARLLGVEGKGAYTAWTLSAFILAITLAGPVPVGLGRLWLAGADVHLVKPVIVHAGLIALIAGACSGGAVLLGADPTLSVAVFAVGVPLTALTQDALTVLQAGKYAIRFALVRIVNATTVSMCLAVGLLIGVGAPLSYAFIAYGVGAAASAAAALAAVHASPGLGQAASLSEAFRRGKGTTLANVFDLLTLRVDQLFVALVGGPAALGVYSVAVNWSEVAQYVGLSAGQAVFEDESTLDNLALRRIVLHVSWLMAGATLIILGAGWFSIAPLFGADFIDARYLLLLMAPGVAARGVGYTLGQVLLARGRGSAVSHIMVSTTLCGIGGWIGLTAAFGPEGAAATSTLVYTAQMAGLLVLTVTPERAAVYPPGEGQGSCRPESDSSAS